MKTLLAILLLFTLPGFAAEPLHVIAPSDPDYSYYRRAVDLDEDYVRQDLIGPYADFDTSKIFKDVPGSNPIRGRFVIFNDGNPYNPVNLVVSLNGALYYIDSDLSSFDSKFSLRRVWDDDAGIFLIFHGHRSGANQGEIRDIEIHLKIATPGGRVLKILGYQEE
jgi:hypothetical protein